MQLQIGLHHYIRDTVYDRSQGNKRCISIDTTQTPALSNFFCTQTFEAYSAMVSLQAMPYFYRIQVSICIGESSLPNRTSSYLELLDQRVVDLAAHGGKDTLLAESAVQDLLDSDGARNAD